MLIDEMLEMIKDRNPGVELKVDGSQGEGGGQVLRLSLAIASLCRTKALTVNNIRAGRSKPGLAAQHATGVRLVASISGYLPIGADVGSSTIQLTQNPDTTPPRTHVTADAHTAGATTLLLQAALPSFLFCPQSQVVTGLELRGGTNVPFSPPVDHTRLVLLPLLKSLMGISLAVTVQERGYYPVGGGRITVTRVGTSTVPRAFTLDTHSGGKISRATVVMCGKDLPTGTRDVASHEAMMCLRDLSGDGEDVEISIDNSSLEEKPDHEKGKRNPAFNCIFVVELVDGGAWSTDALMEKRDFQMSHVEEQVRVAGNRAIALKNSGCRVDARTADQLLIYMALASGQSRLHVGPRDANCKHLETGVTLVRNFLGRSISWNGDVLVVG